MAKYKWLLLIAIVALVTVGLSRPASALKPGLFFYGDTNCDGNLTSYDSTGWLNILSTGSFNNSNCHPNSIDIMDLDGDGMVTDLDYNIFRQMFANSSYPSPTTGLPARINWIDVSSPSVSIGGDPTDITVEVLASADSFKGGLARAGVGVVFELVGDNVCVGSTVITLSGRSVEDGSSFTGNRVFEYTDTIDNGGKATVELNVPNDSSCNLRTVSVTAYVPADDEFGTWSHRLENRVTAQDNLVLWVGGDVIFVDASNTEEQSPDGSSWPEAYTTINDGNDHLGTNGALFVAAGLYDGATPYLSMDQDTAWFGGFVGTETHLGARKDPFVQRTIIKHADGYDWILNMYFDNSTIDGFWFIDGDNTGSYLGGDDGGAILVEGENNIIRNCVFAHNHADGLGGAIYGHYPVNLLIDNCRFMDNDSEYGGAIACNGCDDLTITGSEFSDYLHESLTTADYNEATADGGAVYVTNGATVTIDQCVFKRNSADDNGGAVSLISGTNAEVKHSIFNENQAEYGGAIYETTSDPLIFNNLFYDNSCSYAGACGGAIRNSGSDAYVKNCTFYENYGYYGYAISNVTSDITVRYSILDDTTWIGGEIDDDANSSTDIQYCVIGDGTSCTGCDDTSPTFVTGTDPDNQCYLDDIITNPINAGPVSSTSVGLDDRTTQADGSLDEDDLDWGFHDSE